MLVCLRDVFPFNSMKIFLLLAACCLLALTSCKSDSVTQNGSDSLSVVYSFAVMGCNRVQSADTNSAISPSHANLAHLDRSFDEIAALNPKPDFLVFVGDLVYGETPDSSLLARQLIAWKAHFEESAVAKAGIKLYASQGNHESYNDKRVSLKSAEQCWAAIMSDYIGSNGPASDPEDTLTTDQSRLSYSFDYKGDHIVILNTDAVGREQRAPTNWVDKDLTAARSAGAKHLFVLGHQPAYSHTGSETGLDQYPQLRDQFWTMLETHQVDAMITAHNHLYERTRPTNRTWMIIAGHAGSKLEKELPEKDKYYGYVTISVLKNGNVIERSYGRDIAAGGYMSAPTGPTTVRDSAEISWK